MPARAWAGILIAFIGVFCVINNSLSELTLSGGTVVGDAMFVAIAAVWALYGALSRPVIARVGAARSAAWAAFLGAVFLLPVAVPGALDAERLHAIADGVALTRWLIDTPANDMEPDAG